jgi:aquaporin Z
MHSPLIAEFLGTFVLVPGRCGSAVLAAGVADVGIGWLSVSLAFGLTVMCMAYAVGGISGGHFNPAVTPGLKIAGRLEGSLPLYWVAQVAGSIAAATVLFVIVSGQAGFAGTGGFASKGYGAASPGVYSMMSGLVTEVVLTAIFLVIILGATAPRVPAGFAPIAIGLGLTLIHLVSIPVTNTSVNPARSTGVALFAGPTALSQLWLFWVAPLAGGVLGAIAWGVMKRAAATAPGGATPAE